MQRLAATIDMLAGVEYAFLSLAVFKQNEAGSALREKAHIARVALAFQCCDEPRKIDKRRLQRVVDHLARRYGKWLPTVLRAGPMLDSFAHWRFLFHLHLRLRFFAVRGLGGWLLCDGVLGTFRFAARRQAVFSRRANELRDGHLDGFISGQLRLGVEREVTLSKTERAEHRIIAGVAFATRVKEVPEEEVERVCGAVVLHGQRAGGALGLRSLQEGTQCRFLERTFSLQVTSPNSAAFSWQALISDRRRITASIKPDVRFGRQGDTARSARNDPAPPTEPDLGSAWLFNLEHGAAHPGSARSTAVRARRGASSAPWRALGGHAIRRVLHQRSTACGRHSGSGR